MSEERPEAPRRFHLSIDTWAVIAALLVALLVRTGVVTCVPW